MSMPLNQADLSNRYAGLLVGTAVGDALGLPAEGISRQRIQSCWHGQWRHRLVFGRGMISDDTEHTLFVAQALLAHPDDAVAFQRCLAWKLRLWLLGAPAGVGLATLRAIMKLWLGFSPARSGVYSAGNGPAMRSALIGACFCDAPEKRRAFISAATRLTHTDLRAETAALAVAEAAAWAMQAKESAATFAASLPGLSADSEWQKLCGQIQQSLAAQLSVTAFADALGLAKGVSGYAYHSVPVALYAVLRHEHDFSEALRSALDCGGDTDTVGAIVGALAGARLGASAIPGEWVSGIWEWPRSVTLLQMIAERLAKQKAVGTVLGPVSYFWPGLILRNILFILVVLAHGFARLWPWWGRGTGRT